MNEMGKCGLFFLAGLAVGALGAVAVTRGKLNVKPLASELLSGGMELRDKIMSGVEGVKEDLEDVVAEAQVKAAERRQAKEASEAAAQVAEAAEAVKAPAA